MTSRLFKAEELQIRHLNLDLYNLIESPVFIKDTQGCYLWANSYFINRSAGFQSLTEIINKTDADFPWHHYADELHSNDKRTLSNRQSQSHYERIIRFDGIYVDILTRKSPLLDNNDLIGLIGFSIERPSSTSISLSNREKECVYWLSHGYTDKKIANKLNISPRTVETHLASAKCKFNIATRAELIAAFCRAYP